MISLLGFNEKRGEDIKSQRQITNANSLSNKDPVLYGLLTNSEYNFPKNASDVSYGD